jgi:hypothetical protein
MGSITQVLPLFLFSCHGIVQFYTIQRQLKRNRGSTWILVHKSFYSFRIPGRILVVMCPVRSLHLRIYPMSTVYDTILGKYLGCTTCLVGCCVCCHHDIPLKFGIIRTKSILQSSIAISQAKCGNSRLVMTYYSCKTIVRTQDTLENK